MGSYSITDHFRDKQRSVKQSYDAIVRAAERFGPVRQEAKKTSIHLVRKTAFAGVATRKSALLLTLKSETNLKSDRMIRREQVSQGRWHLIIRVESPKEVDSELKKWLKAAFELS